MITIQYIHELDGKLGSKQVDPLYQKGDWALTWGDDSHSEPLKYSITHIPSGMALDKVFTYLQHGRRAVKLLNDQLTPEMIRRDKRCKYGWRTIKEGKALIRSIIGY